MPLTSTTTPTPKNFLILLFHGHQLLDHAGPTDILATVAKHAEGGEFTCTYAAEDRGRINLAAIAPRGASWVFEDSPEMKTMLDSQGRKKLSGSGFNPSLYADVTFEDALASLRKCGRIEVEDEFGEVEKRTIDVLLIPGGVGTRLYRVDKASGERTLNVQSCVDFAQEVCVGGWVQSAVMTVCTGSDLFARTGLLDGRRATTNFNAFGSVSARHGGVTWLERRRWVRSKPDELEMKGKGGGFEREVWTSAGISAGMDLTLWFVAEVWGIDFARSIGRKLEYEWRENVREGEVDGYYPA